jgi:hypothetical protein
MNQNYFAPNIPSIEEYTHCTPNGKGEYIYWYSPQLSKERIDEYIKDLLANGFVANTLTAPTLYTDSKNDITINIDPLSVRVVKKSQEDNPK